MTQLFRIYWVRTYSRTPLTDQDGQIIELPMLEAERRAQQESLKHPGRRYRTVMVRQP